MLKSKTSAKAVFAALALIITAFAWLYVIGWTSRSGSRYTVSKVELYRNPTLVAIHLKNPPGVFLIRNASGRNESDFLQWISPENADITSIEVSADSIYSRWSNTIDDRDIVQFGIHGHPRGSTRPTFEHNNELHVGIAPDHFNRGSFSIVTLSDFSNLGLPKPANEFTVYGNLTFSIYRHFSLGPKPRGPIGP